MLAILVDIRSRVNSINNVLDEVSLCFISRGGDSAEALKATLNAGFHSKDDER